MIENINYTSFLKYGSIEHAGFSFAVNQQKNGVNYIFSEFTINLKEVNSLLTYTDNVVLDIVSGVALLYITHSVGEDGYFFLLDKTVIINPNLFFNVVSLYGSCCYQLGYLLPGYIVETPVSIVGPLGLFSNISISKIHTLFYQEKEKGFVFKGESHDFWELTYIDKGKMYTKVDDTTLMLEQGEAIFYSSSQYHSQWCDDDLSVSFITITFDMNMDASILSSKIHYVDNEMKTLLEKILVEKENNSLYSEDLILCYLKEFVIKLVRNSRLEKAIIQQDSNIKTRIDDTIINKCTDFIGKNIENKITVPDVARSIPISPSYLSSIFRKKLNMTVVDYINNFRLEKSKVLIKTSNLNFTQISDKLGYNSVHYFSRQFKSKYGISPSAYAKSIKR